MRKKISRIFIGTLVLGIIALLLVILVPRSYKVLEFEARENTKYWHLNTGSTIGYQKLAAENDENKPPIIYLHGGPGGKITDNIIEMLAPLSQEDYDIYLYDQLGSGHSNRLEHISDYSVERHKSDLKEIIDKIGAEQVILLGQSWGAMLAMEFLIDHPSRVAQLILTGPGPILPINPSLANKPKPDSLNLIAPKYSNRAGNQKAANLRTRCLNYMAVIFGVKMATDQEADNFFTYLNNELQKSTRCIGDGLPESRGGGGYYAHVMTVKSFQDVENRKDQLKGMETPLLIIKGQCDNQKWGFTEEYISLLPNTSVEIIEGAGHTIGKEHQAEYLSLIRAFID